MADIPQELLEEILSRLPVKSLVRFKTVSKNCYSSLSKDHNFANFHLKQSSSSTSDENLIFFLKIDCLGTTTFQSSNIDTNASHKYNLPVEIAPQPYELKLVGSTNGLICLAPFFEGKYCCIWNPCIGECKKISLPVGMVGYSLFGFGYDPCSDDYKIVGDWGDCFRIFSLKTNSWKILKDSTLPMQKELAFHLNGAFHWCIDRKIVVFDLAKEKFSYMELPEEVESTGFSISFLDHQGSLCASGGKSIWVMKKYGDSKSWAKLTTFVANKHVNPVGISRLGELVFRTWPFVFEFDLLVKSDVQGRISDDELRMICNDYEHTFAYKESLISPKCFDSLHPPSKKLIRGSRKQRNLIRDLMRMGFTWRDGSSWKFRSE